MYIINFIGEILCQSRRVRNKICSLINLLKLYSCNVKCGRNCTIHGHVGLSISEAAKVSIGNGFYMSNGKHQNPLCGNAQGHIHVENGAILKIGDFVAVSSLRIWCAKKIIIGNNVKMGGGVTLIDTDAHSMDWKNRRIFNKDQSGKHDKEIIIDNDVFVGMHTIILKGVTIGARTIIGAGSVVTKNIPSDCVACGNPARVIKRINNNENIGI